MPDLLRPLPSRDALREHVLVSLRRYWKDGEGAVRTLPVHETDAPDVRLPLLLIEVTLPEWGRGCGIDGKLFVPQEACVSSPADWQSVDWWLAAFLLLEGWHERILEAQRGPIHSYSRKLRGWDTRAWERAWVNRIAIFLRRWVAELHDRPEEGLFGPLPEAEILLTHDVDAVKKTVAIRIKQSLFLLFNALRFLTKGEFSSALKRLSQGAKFLFRNSSWQTFDDLLELEFEASVRACYNFYADGRPKNLRRLFFDPGYSLSDPEVGRLLCTLSEKGMQLGLHPSFDSWSDGDAIGQQKLALERTVGKKIDICRQHWLRFSWEFTWSAQEKAGLGLDTTLMFNDHAGFRTSSALQWHPYNPDTGRAHTLEALPTLFMDSHFYDYAPVTAQERRRAISEWLGEVRSVGGQAALLWHPHTLSEDYGWHNGLRDVVHNLREAKNDHMVHSQNYARPHRQSTVGRQGKMGPDCTGR